MANELFIQIYQTINLESVIHFVCSDAISTYFKTRVRTINGCKKVYFTMRKVLNKLRSNTEVRDVLDAAESLETSEGAVLDTGLAIYSPTFHSSVSESAPLLKDRLTTIGSAARRYVTAFNESFSQRSIKSDLSQLLANQDEFARLKEVNRELERKYRACAEAVQKKQTAVDKAQTSADPLALSKARIALNIAKDQLDTSQRAYFQNNEQFDRDSDAYRLRIVELLTTPLERMVDSRRTALLKVRDCGQEIIRSVDEMVFEEENDAGLEQELELINRELAEIDH